MATEKADDPLNRRDIYDAQPYHLEKYIVPGAMAVVIFFLLPSYLIGKGGLGGVDLGAAIVGSLVVGHLIESLKVYQWNSDVKANFRVFNGQVDTLLEEWGITDDEKHSQRELAKSALFTVVGEGAGSEFAWNLVRWQKMTVIAETLKYSAFLWFAFAVIALVGSLWYNPFTSTLRVSFLREDIPGWVSAAIEGLIGIVLLISGRKVRQYGMERQLRTNKSYLLLIRRYKTDIVNVLRETVTRTTVGTVKPGATS